MTSGTNISTKRDLATRSAGWVLFCVVWFPAFKGLISQLWIYFVLLFYLFLRSLGNFDAPKGYVSITNWINVLLLGDVTCYLARAYERGLTSAGLRVPPVYVHSHSTFRLDRNHPWRNHYNLFIMSVRASV